MAISDQELKHGMAIRSIFLGLALLPGEFSYKLVAGEESRSSYELIFFSCNSIEIFRLGLFVKTSSSRRSPWGFTFTYLHQLEINLMKEKCADVFVILVAGDDGVACINHEQLKELLDENYEEAEWVSLSRKLNESYRVAGRDGGLSRPLARNSFPGSIVKKVEALLMPPPKT